jgi:hypothetical protein
MRILIDTYVVLFIREKEEEEEKEEEGEEEGGEEEDCFVAPAALVGSFTYVSILWTIPCKYKN